MGKKVFVAEDDIMLASIYDINLTKEGFDVTIEKDGAAALQKMLSEPPDVAILDLLLPGLSGLALLETMRREEKLKNVPVIIVTNLDQGLERERGAAAHVRAYFVKAQTPFPVLVAKVKEILSEPKPTA